MTPRYILPLFIVAGALALARSADDKKPAAAPTFTAEQVAFYEKQALPILEKHCYKCHAGDKLKGGLSLESRAALLRGGEIGPALSPQKLESSLLLKAVHYKDGLEMPPSGKLAAEQLDVLTKWVKMGAPFTPGKEAVVKTPAHKGMVITDADRNWWAYRPIKPPSPPAVKDAAWTRNPIDHFILAKIEGAGLAPVAPAERVALIRRAYYDLTGLPPTPAQIDDFVSDTSPDAVEKLVDALLASPGYGEKWGRHWLDLVRYAETNGYERDGPKPFAWRFRDYVIRGFNDDKPYDRFVKEQLAGDELPGREADAITATGYYRLGLWDDEPADPKQARADEIDDWVSTTGQVFLGTTFNCARCHDHKKDPIPQTDYYKLASFFEDVKRYSNSRDPRTMTNLSDISPPEVRTKYQAEMERREVRRADIDKEMHRLEDVAIKKMSEEDQRRAEGPERADVIRRLRGVFTKEQQKTYNDLRDEKTALLRKLDPPGRVMALSVTNCLVKPPETHVLVRGNPHVPGAKVKPGFPAVLGGVEAKVPEPEKSARSSGRRTALADWITTADNPLTARVMVNRVWQWHFGKGLCPTPSDFGKLGELPTHPELLDFLASEFVRGGWQIKRLHRLILLSSTYRLSSQSNTQALQKDPANALLWRFPMRRLTAEEVRDSILTVSGELNRKAGGASVYPKIPREVLQGQSRPGEGWGRSPTEEAARRSVYVYIKRSLIVPILQNHDLADTDSTCAVRYTTTVPTQALGMLNGEFTNEQARAFAGRLMNEAPGKVDEQVKLAIRLTTGRIPTDDEVKRDVAFINETMSESKLDAKAALAIYCLLALNSNEFLYLD